MDKIVFKISKNSLIIASYIKDTPKEDLNNTNIINTKEIYFSYEYIIDNLELVSSFLNVIILKQNVSKCIIKEYNLTSISLDIIKNISTIRELEIKENTTINYDLFLKILDNKFLTKINVYDIPKYLLERLDLNSKIDVTIRREILFISNFMESNKLNTYSDIYYKKNIIINNKFDSNDINDFISFIRINDHLKLIEFTYLDQELFELIISEIINNKKNNLKIIFDEKTINIKEHINYLIDYKNKNEKIIKDLNINFKINYSEEYKKNNLFKQINLNIIKITLLGIIIIAIAMIGINLFKNYQDDKKSDEIEEKIKSIMNIPTITQNEENEPTTNNFEYISPNDTDLKIINTTTTSIYDIKYKMVFDELKEINKDTIGWLKVNNTNIDYPVVQGEDNDYYLNRDYYQNKNRHGWIFVDYRNSIESLNRNTIIYGHNLANQKMFGTLRYALNSAWYEKTNNQIITFNTIYANMRFQIFSIYKVPVTTDYLTTKFGTDEKFMEFINMIKERSIYDFNVEVKPEDHILTLSTCSNGHDQRLVVHAKLLVED